MLNASNDNGIGKRGAWNTIHRDMKGEICQRGQFLPKHLFFSVHCTEYWLFNSKTFSTAVILLLTPPPQKKKKNKEAKIHR